MGMESGGFESVPLVTHDEVLNVDGKESAFEQSYKAPTVAEQIKETEEVIKHQEEELVALEANPEIFANPSIGDPTREEVIEQARISLDEIRSHLAYLKEEGLLEEAADSNAVASQIFKGGPTEFNA